MIGDCLFQGERAIQKNCETFNKKYLVMLKKKKALNCRNLDKYLNLAKKFARFLQSFLPLIN